jgi:hypothetical protein
MDLGEKFTGFSYAAESACVSFVAAVVAFLSGNPSAR